MKKTAVENRRLTFADLRKKPADSTLFEKHLKRMLLFLEKEFSLKSSGISVSLTDETEIKKLNEKWMKHKGATDVLSFCENPASPSGEIILCPSFIRRQAKKEKRDEKEAMAETLLHGFLHLFGLEHDYKPAGLKKIYALQAALLVKMKVDLRGFDV